VESAEEVFNVILQAAEGDEACCEGVSTVRLNAEGSGQQADMRGSCTAHRHAVLVGGVPCIALGHGVLPVQAAQASAPAASTATTADTAHARQAPAATAPAADPFRIRAVLAHAYFGDRAAVLRDAAAAASAGQAAVFAAVRHYPGQLVVGPAVRDPLTQLITGFESRCGVDTSTGADDGSGDASAAARLSRCGDAGDLLHDASPKRELATA
jgi:hypothetical protein